MEKYQSFKLVVACLDILYLCTFILSIQVIPIGLSTRIFSSFVGMCVGSEWGEKLTTMKFCKGVVIQFFNFLDYQFSSFFLGNHVKRKWVYSICYC